MGMKTKERLGNDLCAPAVRKALGAHQHEGWTKQRQLPSAQVTLVSHRLMFLSQYSQWDSRTQAGTAGCMIWHYLPQLPAPWHCCTQGTFKGCEGKTTVHPAVVGG